MRESDRQRVLDLLQQLQGLETTEPASGEQAIHELTTRALADEISRLIRQDWLSVYRNGDSLDVVCLT
ncbi:MAG: hypothetical protein VX951_03405 [Planctomycetota bacterium]|nr:hypothetical protein [Planctomycetota bacterium]